MAPGLAQSAMGSGGFIRLIERRRCAAVGFRVDRFILTVGAMRSRRRNLAETTACGWRLLTGLLVISSMSRKNLRLHQNNTSYFDGRIQNLTNLMLTIH
jgi:hypothetical protein